MQTLDIISVNIWQMAVSLGNLVLLFLIVKKFLYKPVKNMLKTRQSTIDGNLASAEEAKANALADQKLYNDKLKDAKIQADGIIKDAVDTANEREKEIISQAKEKADGIVRQAQIDAELERKKAEESIKKEIVEVSSMLTEKLLEREVTKEDHKNFIDSFIESIGDEDDAN